MIQQITQETRENGYIKWSRQWELKYPCPELWKEKLVVIRTLNTVDVFFNM